MADISSNGLEQGLREFANQIHINSHGFAAFLGYFLCFRLRLIFDSEKKSHEVDFKLFVNTFHHLSFLNSQAVGLNS